MRLCCNTALSKRLIVQVGVGRSTVNTAPFFANEISRLGVKQTRSGGIWPARRPALIHINLLSSQSLYDPESAGFSQ
jgi:hypothetical protein